MHAGSEQPQPEARVSEAEDAGEAALTGEAPILVKDTPELEGEPAQASAPEPSGGSAAVRPAAGADADEKAEEVPAEPAAESSEAPPSGEAAGEKQEEGQPEREAEAQAPEDAPEEAPPETPSPLKKPPVPKRKRDAETAPAPASKSKVQPPVSRPSFVALSKSCARLALLLMCS